MQRQKIKKEALKKIENDIQTKNNQVHLLKIVSKTMKQFQEKKMQKSEVRILENIEESFNEK